MSLSNLSSAIYSVASVMSRRESLLGECLALVAGCQTMADCDRVRDDFATQGSVWRALSAKDREIVKIAGQTRRAMITMASIPAPLVAAPIAVVPTTIEASLATIVQSSVRAATRNSRATATRVANTVQSIIAEGACLAKSIATVGDGAELRHGYAIVNHLTRRDALLDCLTSIGMSSLAPKAPTGIAHLGEAMQRLNNNSLIARRSDDAPDGVDARHFVWAIKDARTTGSLGTADLIVDLTDGVLTFTPPVCTVEINDQTVDAVFAVQNAYDKRIAGETYNSTTMLAWLKDTLVGTCYARACYDTVYVGAGQVDRARVLVDALDATGVMGRRMVGLVTMPTDRGLRAGLLCGFIVEIEKIEKSIDDGKVSPITLIQDLYRYQKAVEGFEVLIGVDAVADLKAKITGMHLTCSARLDALSERTANLELT